MQVSLRRVMRRKNNVLRIHDSVPALTSRAPEVSSYMGIYLRRHIVAACTGCIEIVAFHFCDV